MIVLLRHAETLGGAGLCVGRTSLPLSPTGQAMAQRVADGMHGGGFSRLCSSPAKRALETIAPVAQQLGMAVDSLPAVNEIDMGSWDGLPFEQIRHRFPEAYARRGSNFGDFRPPGGESFNNVADRAMVALADIEQRAERTLVATHAGVIRSVLCRITGHPMDDLFHFAANYACCTVLSMDGDGWTVDALDILPEELPPLM